MIVLSTNMDTEVNKYLDSIPHSNRKQVLLFHVLDRDTLKDREIRVYMSRLLSDSLHKVFSNQVDQVPNSVFEGVIEDMQDFSHDLASKAAKSIISNFPSTMVVPGNYQRHHVSHYRTYSAVMTLPTIMATECFKVNEVCDDDDCNDDHYLCNIYDPQTNRFSRGVLGFLDFDYNGLNITPRWRITSELRSLQYDQLGLLVCDYSSQYFHDSVDHYNTEDGYTVLSRYESELYYCERYEEYYFHEENMPEQDLDDEEFNFSYHKYGTITHDSFHDARNTYKETYFVGYEVEKDDDDCYHDFIARELLRNTNFRKEDDSSIESNTGYELISPVYEFDLDIIKSDISKYFSIQELLRGDYTSRCGMHVTLSHSSYKQDEIWSKLVNYLPLLYALYPSRTTKVHCLAPRNGWDIDNYRAKYRPLHLKGRDKVEIRIFPSVMNEKQLLWRLELVQIMLGRNVRTLQGLKHYVTTGRIKNHLKIVYGENQVKFDNLLVRIQDMNDEYNIIRNSN